MENRILFDKEFPSEFRPPQQLVDLVGVELQDLSWHNDVCPSFGILYPETGDHRLIIWSDAEKCEDREWQDTDQKRFSLIFYKPDFSQEILLETDSVVEIIEMFMHMKEVICARSS